MSRGAPLSRGRRAAAVALLVVVPVALAPWLAPRDPEQVDEAHRLEAPSLAFPAGTDELGRCVLSRVLHGGRASLLLSLAVAAGAAAVGLLVGGVAAHAGGAVEFLLVGLCDLLLALPPLVLALVVVGLSGPSPPLLALLLVLVDWTAYARLARTVVAAERTKAYVLAEQALGVPGRRVLFGTLLPAATSPVATLAVLRLGRTLAVVAGLGLLGLGVAPPTPEWGAMIGQGRTFLRVAPWVALAPAVWVVAATWAFAALSEALAGGGVARAAEGEP